MATATAGGAAPAVTAPMPAGNQRIGRQRSVMMVLMTLAVGLGLLLGMVALQANLTTYNYYRTIVDEGSVSVDAALRARAAVLDHMAASATYLETTGDAQTDAANRAQRAWETFNNEARISWRNLSDTDYGENEVYTSADRAASDYIQQIGAMYEFYAAGQTDRARESFLEAREILNTRLVPALGGLEAVKVEAMEATYAGASAQIDRWANTLFIIAALASLALVAAIFAVRRMHYRWSWPIGIALILTAGLALAMQFQLTRASDDAEVLVRRAYDNVAGTQGLGALLSQGRALESIAIFDPQGSPQHLESFDQYNALVEQRLCGPRDCSTRTFLNGTDSIDQQVRDAALDEQDRLGLPRAPIVANVHFPGQAAELEALRAQYQGWLETHRQLVGQVGLGQREAASATNTGASAAAFAEVVSHVDRLTEIARGEFNSIWQRVYNLSTWAQVLAIAFPLLGLLAAYGIWRRRSELFV